MQFESRKGKPEDIPDAFRLIQELALYEKAPYEVKTSVESMLEDGFGENPAFNLLVAAVESQVVGIALYFPYYSTWKGRCLYLDDLVVSEAYRGNGIGEALIQALMQEARAMKAQRMLWQVLEWNEPAIRFYKRLNATLDGEWINCKILEDQLYPKGK